MARNSARHSLIVVNLAGEIGLQLKRRCDEVFCSDLRLRVTRAGLYTYPDVMVVCADVQFADDQKTRF
jgi:Uma2 family endonuclease